MTNVIKEDGEAPSADGSNTTTGMDNHDSPLWGYKKKKKLRNFKELETKSREEPCQKN